MSQVIPTGQVWGAWILILGGGGENEQEAKCGAWGPPGMMALRLKRLLEPGRLAEDPWGAERGGASLWRSRCQSQPVMLGPRVLVAL